MLHHAISHARLMRESTDCVQSALHSQDSNEQLIARRILENPAVWAQWEGEHSMLMRQLANCAVRSAQVAALKHTTFRLVHGKALFQYLRRSEIRGTDRSQVIAHFRPGRSYESAMVAEHSVYLRKAASYLCTSHVGSEVIAEMSTLVSIDRPIPEEIVRITGITADMLVNQPTIRPFSTRCSVMRSSSRSISQCTAPA